MTQYASHMSRSSNVRATLASHYLLHANSSPQFTHSNRPSHVSAINTHHYSAQNPTYRSAKSNWRSMVVKNVNHLHQKSAAFESCTAYVKPDVIFGTEAKLDPSTNVQEIPPPLIIKIIVSLTFKIDMEEGHL